MHRRCLEKQVGAATCSPASQNKSVPASDVRHCQLGLRCPMHIHGACCQLGVSHISSMASSRLATNSNPEGFVLTSKATSLH